MNESRITNDKGSRWLISFFVICSSLFLPSTARADIVVFKNGRTMSVKSCLVDGDMATMRLSDGGEVTFPGCDRGPRRSR